MLTGVHTKKEVTDELRSLINREETITLAHLDIDGFAEVNDQRGHDTGDQLLVAISDALRTASSGRNWVLGRIGGDEFVVAMPGLPIEKGFLAMEEVRRSVPSATVQVAGDLAVTVSIGVANFPRDARDVAGLMRKADHALYQAKEAGRNQVSLAWSEEMVLKSCYYATSQLARLKKLAEKLDRKESVLMREALDDLLRKYDKPGI